MVARTYSTTLVGVNAVEVEIESHEAGGNPKMFIVGLPDTSVKESRERVVAAISSSGLLHHDGVITVNLAPADLKKEGTGFDLPIAVSLPPASMRSIPSQPSQAGTLSHMTGLVSTAVHYLRLRVRLVGLEPREAGSRYGVTAGMFAGGAFVAVLGYLFLIITAVFGVAAAFEWKHAWIVVLGGAALLHLGGAVVLFLLGRQRLKTGAFSSTLEEFKKDQEWLTKLASKP